MNQTKTSEEEKVWREIQHPYTFTDEYENATEQDKASKLALHKALEKAKAEGYEEGLSLREAYNDPKLLEKIKTKAFNAGIEAVLEKIPDNLIPAGTNTSYMEGLKSQLKKELTK